MEDKQMINRHNETGQIRWLALAGLLGGILMFAGDMLFYYTPVSGPEFDNLGALAARDNFWLMVGGTLGPVAGFLYALGSLALGLLTRPPHRLTGWFVAISWMIMFMIGGAYHAVYANYGFVGKLPPALRQSHIELVTAQIRMMYGLAFVIGLVSSLVLAWLIGAGKTLLPRWMVLLIPTFLTLLDPVVTPLVPYPLGAVIVGGWVNLCFILFFGLVAWLAGSGMAGMQKEEDLRQ